MRAFRESADPAAIRVKSLEARLAQESQRCLQLETRVQVLCESAHQSAARIQALEARLEDEAGRMLQLEKQMQAFLGRTTHPIAQVRDLEPLIVEQKKPPAVAAPRVEGKVPRQARRKV